MHDEYHLRADGMDTEIHPSHTSMRLESALDVVWMLFGLPSVCTTPTTTTCLLMMSNLTMLIVVHDSIHHAHDQSHPSALQSSALLTAPSLFPAEIRFITRIIVLPIGSPE